MSFQSARVVDEGLFDEPLGPLKRREIYVDQKTFDDHFSEVSIYGRLWNLREVCINTSYVVVRSLTRCRQNV